jgi:hypothetical protein
MTSPRCLLHACLVLCTLVSSVVQAQVYCERRAGYCTYDSSCQCEDTHYDGRYRKMRWNADAGGHCWACECAAGYKYHSFSTLCVACPHGEYQPTDGARPSDCIDCPAGKYQGSEASASCKDCMAGTWNPDTRAIGYSSIYNNGVYCRLCDRGRASSRSGRSTNCPRCPTGKYTYQSELPARYCRTCPSELSNSYEREVCPAPPPPPPHESGGTPVTAIVGVAAAIMVVVGACAIIAPLFCLECVTE